jgi:hypothetical protein
MDIKRYLEKEKIYSIYEDDFINYLISLGILDNIDRGQYICKICNDKININNIGALIPINKQIEIICDKSLCLDNYFLRGDANE